MTKVDQFESVFRAADKAVFRFERVSIDRVAVVTDGTPEQTDRLIDQLRPASRASCLRCNSAQIAPSPWCSVPRPAPGTQRTP